MPDTGRSYNYSMARANTGFFRQSVPPIGLSIERDTPNVPNDGWYHVVLLGEIKGRFRQKKQADELYKTILAESGYKPPKADRTPERNEAIERYLDDIEGYWLDSHNHVRRGGKGRF